MAFIPPLSAHVVAPYSPPGVVQDLTGAANALREAIRTMPNCIETSRAVAILAQQIATCVANSVERAQHRGRDYDLSLAVVVSLNAATDVFNECAKVVRRVVAQNTVRRVLSKVKTQGMMSTFHDACIALRDILRVERHTCLLIDHPESVLRITPEGCAKEATMRAISTVNAAYDGLKTSLNIMVQLTDGLDWPIKAIPQTVLYILKLFEDCRAIQAKITELLVEVQSLWSIVSTVHRPAESSEPLATHLREFYEILQRVVIRLRVAQAVSGIKKLVAIHSVSEVIADETRRLATARRNLSLAFQVTTSVDVAQMRQVMGPEPPSPNLLSNIDFSATPPPAPIIFHGRDDIVVNAVELLVRPVSTCIAVLGTGGIGKTSVALTILHDPKLSPRFSERRFFLSCEALADADATVVALAKLLAVLRAQDLLASVVAQLRSSLPLVLVLDNFETIWLVDDAAQRSAAERLLSTLANIPTLSLVVTCRGVVLPVPQNIRWCNKQWATLEPISLEAARRTFLDITMVDFHDDSAALDELIREVDAMPLAVVLFATLALDGSTPSELLDSWRHSHSALLRTGEGRLHSVEASISTSLTILQGGTDGAEAMQLLSICSILPDGLRPQVYDQLRTQFQHIDNARSRLRALALVTVGCNKQLQMLSPIRHFVQSQYPPLAVHLNSLRASYISIAKNFPTRPGSEFAARAAAVLPELNNLTSVLSAMVSEPTAVLMTAIVDLSWFSYNHFPSATLLLAVLPHVSNRPGWRAVILRQLGRMQLSTHHYTHALKSLFAAVQIYFQLEDPREVAACIRLTGKVYRLVGNNDAAMEAVQTANDMFAQMQDSLGQAQCLHELGQQQSSCGDFRPAVANLAAARQLFEERGDQHSAARWSQALAAAHLKHDDLPAVSAHLHDALTRFSNMGDRHGVAAITQLFGHLHLRQRNFVLAENAFADAREMFTSQGNSFGLAQSAQAFGILRRDQGRIVEARYHLLSAHQCYTELGLQALASECVHGIESLAEIRPISPLRVQADTASIIPGDASHSGRGATSHSGRAPTSHGRTDDFSCESESERLRDALLRATKKKGRVARRRPYNFDPPRERWRPPAADT